MSGHNARLVSALAAQVEEVLQGAEVDAAPLFAVDVRAQHSVRLAGTCLAVCEDADVVPCGRDVTTQVLSSMVTPLQRQRGRCACIDLATSCTKPL